MDREVIFEYAAKTYRTAPEYLWAKYPDDAILRHSDNNKWYAVIMNVTKDKLGLGGLDEVGIINVKCEPEMIGALRMTKGILPGYHMNKSNWVSVLLDGSVGEELIYNLLDRSYELTGPKKKPNLL